MNVAVSESAGIRRLERLAASFHVLRNAPGVQPWDAEALDRWASTLASSGERHAARFVLSVYNSTARWRCGPFNVALALSTWDSQGWSAFRAWVNAPFIL